LKADKDFLVFSIIALALLSFFPTLAGAHAFPDHSDPKVGASVKSSPPLIRIWFDSDLEPAFSNLSVHDSDNKAVDKQDSKVDSGNPKLLEVSVPELPAGEYRVIWSVVARDGHRTNGDFRFKVKK
jgi:copper resistance protein C